MTVLCVVQARAGSTRLPGKVLADVGGRPMLRYMLDRLAGLPVDELVVATTDLDRDTPVASVATDAGRPVVRGSEADVLDRFMLALDTYPADTVVRLTADCPLIDSAVVEQVLRLHQERGADYTCNVLPRTFPQGLDAEVIAASALRVAAAEAVLPPEREHVTPFLYRHPERFRLANLRSGVDLGDERWTVDTAEDLEFVRGVADSFGERIDYGWQDVLDIAPPSAERDSGGVRLRPAEVADSDEVFRWRNDPDAVRQSISGRAVTPDEHRTWFTERLQDPGSRIWIAEADGESVGSLRIDVVAAVGTVSVAIGPDRRGRGLGTAALRALTELLRHDQQVDVLEAHVKAENEGSLRAFENAGFRPTASTGAVRVLRWEKMGSPGRESAS